MRSVSVSRGRNTSFETRNNKSFLPRVSVSRNADDSSFLCDNPFYVPPDEEMFEYKEKQREVRNSIRKMNRDLKIWEKGPEKPAQYQLRKMLQNSCIQDEESTLNDSRATILEAARSAARRRVKSKESVRSFLDKKREMFLFQLNINEKKEQIKEFEEIAHLQEISLNQSMQMMEKDAETFHKYFDGSRKAAAEIIKKAEEETRETQKFNTEMKKLDEQLSNSVLINAKRIEELEKLYSYKVFIDHLTPDDYFAASKKMIENKREGSTRSLGSRKSDENIKKNNIKWEKYDIHISQQLIDFLGRDEEQHKMYFKNPEQLHKIFETLEEKNLFLMRNIQEVEQNLENLRHNFNKRKNELVEKKKQLTKNKQDLTKSLQTKIQTIGQIHPKGNEYVQNELIYRRMEKGIKQLHVKVCGESKNDIDESAFGMLRDVEKKLEIVLKELNLHKPQRILELYKGYIQKRREEENILKKERTDMERKLKIENNLKRLDTRKRAGRPIMKKSFMVKEKKQEEVKNIVNEEEIERQKYFTVRFL